MALDNFISGIFLKEKRDNNYLFKMINYYAISLLEQSSCKLKWKSEIYHTLCNHPNRLKVLQTSQDNHYLLQNFTILVGR